MLYCYFGHHKCASTWIRSILREVTWAAGLTHKEVFCPFLKPEKRTGLITEDREHLAFDHIASYLQQKKVQFAGFPNAVAEVVCNLESVDFRGFHVIRDPRDLIVSAYFSHLYSHPTDILPALESHRKRLAAVSKEEGLLLEMEFSSPILHDLGAWDYSHANILELKMEELTARPYEGFVRIFEFLGLLDEGESYSARRRVRLFVREMLNRASFRYRWLKWLRQPMPVTGELLLGRVWDHRFEKKARRRRGEEDPRSHYRKGQPGDWRNHFTEEHVAAFKEKFGDLVVRLGYEPDNDWGLTPREPVAQTPTAPR
ncbi:sulfotransferase domain-containing protein [Rhodothermus marinus]|uniref:sulfotransferase domain-containing protein n=1 Tax=Rhodothermus marinus TaxID=29549 RepID=UPI0006D168E9|nr:sulfotransferase domain-containing protein [Rhodothermus marinus]